MHLTGALRPLAVAISIAVGFVFPSASADDRPLRPPPPGRLVDVPSQARPEQPDAAAEFARMKRMPTGSVDPTVAMDEARTWVLTRPRYSTRLGGMLPVVPATDAVSKAARIAFRTLATWEPVGPGNIGGRIRAFVINPQQPDTMYVAGVSGGVWKTTNGGGSWTAMSDRLVNIAVNSLAMSPDNPEVLYAGTGEGYFREEIRGTWLPLRGAGVFITRDGGASWSLLGSTDTADFHWVNDLVISPRATERMYAATRTGVWRSDDAGESWGRILDPEVNGGCLDLALRTDTGIDALFASCGTLEQATVYRADDAAGDLVWDAVLSDPGMGRTYLAIAPSDQETVYALAASNVGGPGNHFEQGLHAVFRSASGGDSGSWSARVRNTDPNKLNTLLLSNPAAAMYLDCGWYDSNRWVNMGWYANIIAVDPVDPDVVWAAGVDLFRSDDGGRNWGVASYWWLGPGDSTFVHADQHAVIFHPDYDGVGNRTMFAANDGGVFRTTNARARVGTTVDAVCDPSAPHVFWTGLNHDLGVTQFYHGAPYPGGTRYLGGTQDNGTITGADFPGANGWYPILGGDGGYVAVDPQDTNTLYAEWQWFSFVKSTDGGLSFEGRTTGVTESSSDFLFITPFIMDPNDRHRLWTGGHRLWRTDNGAVWWRSASTSLSGYVSALAVAPGDSDTVLVGASSGDIYRSRNAVSATGSTTWSHTRPRDGFVSWIAFDPSTVGVAYATYAGFGGTHVWRSDDYGATWTGLDGTGEGALPDIPVHSIVVDPMTADRLYLGTDLGVFTSIDGGATWLVEEAGFASAVTESLALGHSQDGTPLLFAFTHGRGAWRVELRRPPAPRRPGSRVGGR